jgi:curli biogenesis system outer membrane secretion channel CsgG
MRRHILFRLTVVLLAIPSTRGRTQAPRAPRSELPSITVTAFEYGAVASQLSGDARARGRLERIGVRDGSAFAEALGTGAADLIVEKLVESERFRVFERKQLDAVKREQQLDAEGQDAIARARYVVTGSVTRLGLNEKDVGGVAGGLATRLLFGHFAAIGAKQSSTTVHLTARVVDTRTGEIIGSFTGEGVSNKRWGVTVFGLGPGGFGGGRVQDSNFKETAIGEAATRAAAAIADRVVALRATRLGP